MMEENTCYEIVNEYDQEISFSKVSDELEIEVNTDEGTTCFILDKRQVERLIKLLNPNTNQNETY